MSETAVTTYDEVPYTSKPLYPTHPDCLAVAGRLRGMQPAPPSRCRVLELGCASGGNLIPMAYGLPESEFIGIDLSSAQISQGQSQCAEIGLPNIELRAGSILDLDESLGKFDYIICHGVYSWVPRPVQDRILWICRHLLASQGVAYVSYNCYPGWHRRSIARELMRFHVSRFDDRQVQIQQARTILEFMAKATDQCRGPLAPWLALEAKMLKENPDYYVFHEHLEDVNSPLYFYEFVGRARADGLQYLGEAWSHARLDEIPPDILEAFQEISSDLVELEQFVDFLANRTFRRTLLCHDDIDVVRTPAPDVMHNFLYSALAEPLSEKPELTTTALEKFQLDTGNVASTNVPILKAALVTLYETWPLAMSFDDLFSQAVERSQVVAEKHDAMRALLSSLLLDGYLAHIVAVHCEPFRFVRHAGQRPQVSALARLAAQAGNLAPNLRHRLVPIAAEDLPLIRAADGTRTLDQIRAVLAEGASPEAAVESTKTNLTAQLERIARLALLVG